MVCERPKHIRRDDRGQLHCENGPSIAWDGFELFHWHGTVIPKEWVTGNKPTAAEALKQENLELRRCACEIVGWAAILKELNARIIDSDDDPEIGSLLECKIPDSGKELFLRVQCGTKREFALLVTNSKARTALEAQAWIHQLDLSEFVKPEIRT
jgi:hypothetical protein